MWTFLAYAAAATAAPTQSASTDSIDPSLAENLKDLCMSERGVQAVVEGVSEQRNSQRLQQQKLDLLNTELGAAADANPLDVDRLRRAAEARDRYRYEMDRETTAQTMAMLERLSPPDRVIFAWQLDLNFKRVRFPMVSCKSR